MPRQESTDAPATTADRLLAGPRPYVWLTAFCFALYAQTLSFGYVFLDDNALVLENLRNLSRWSYLATVFRQDVFSPLHGVTAYYRPVFTLSLMLDAHLWGSSALGYHLTNVVLHAAAVGLLFGLLERLGYRRALAFAAALLFAAHPALVLAVALIPGRNDPLGAIFVLAAFLSALDYWETGKKAPLWRHHLFFALGLLTKETAVALAPLCLIYRGWVARPARRDVSWGLWAGWAAIGAAWLWARHAALTRPLDLTAAQMAAVVWRNSPALVPYLGKALLPFDLSLLPVLPDMTFLYGVAALLLTAGALRTARDTEWPRIAFGLLWFVLFLAPSLMLANQGAAPVFFEHRLYLPLAGLLIVALELLPAAAIVATRARTAFALTLALFALITAARSREFRDRFAFWTAAVRGSPHSSLAQLNLGAMLQLAGNPGEASRRYREALRLDGLQPMAHNNLGTVLTAQGLDDEAEKEYLQEIAVNPGYASAYFNLGLLYRKKGALRKAALAWEKTIAVNPDDAQAYADLAACYRDLRDAAQTARVAELMRRRGWASPPGRP